jgi:class 3 adenylate cyclase
MQDANASGSPVFEALPAKYSDYIICGQRNTRSLESINAELTATAARYFALAATLTLILSLLASFYFTIPIRQLTEAMQKIISEDYSVRLIEAHPDEFAIAARAFNKMAAGLMEGKLLRNFVSESVRESRADSNEAAEANICQVTVLFSSIKGFAALQNQLTPEELFALMQAHLSAAVEIAPELGGEIDKMIEDKIMIVFQHNQKAGNAAVSAAISAAAHIRNNLMATCRYNTAAGINTGEVVSGTMGATSVRLSKTVVGDTVNLAARLASVAADIENGGIVVSGASAQLATGGHHFQKLPISSVKGKTHSVEAYLA